MSDWTEVTLGDLFELDNSRLGERETEPNVLSLSKYDGFVRADEYFDKRIASAKLDLYKVVPIGGWAYSTIHIDEGSVARNSSEPGVISPMYTTMRWKGDDFAVPCFIELAIRQPVMLHEYKRRAQGSVNRRRSLPFSTFAEISVTIPPLSEQRRIVALVLAVDSCIGALYSEITQANILLDQVRSRIPRGRQVCMGDVLVGIDSGRSVRTDGEIPHAGHPRILKVSAVRPGAFFPGEAKSLSATLPEIALVRSGDLLMTRSNTPDKVGYTARARTVPRLTYMPDLIWRLRINESLCDPDYLEQALSSPLMRSRVMATATGTSASMRKVNKRGVSAVALPLPSLTDQRAYASRCLAVAATINTVSTELSALRKVRSDLLTALLSQEVTVDEAVDRFVEVG